MKEPFYRLFLSSKLLVRRENIVYSPALNLLPYVALSPGILVHHRAGHYVEFTAENYENLESFY